MVRQAALSVARVGDSALKRIRQRQKRMSRVVSATRSRFYTELSHRSFPLITPPSAPSPEEFSQMSPSDTAIRLLRYHVDDNHH